MFNESNVNVLSEVKDWEESIKLASEPLIKSGNIEQSYVDAMIKSINDLGFYIILGEHIAMPHARPESGVNETGVSFLKVNSKNRLLKAYFKILELSLQFCSKKYNNF